jgi:hypothetical protein
MPRRFGAQLLFDDDPILMKFLISFVLEARKDFSSLVFVFTREEASRAITSFDVSARASTGDRLTGQRASFEWN